MNGRRRMMTGVRPLWIFESGNEKFTNGELKSGVWNGMPKFSGGEIIVKAAYYVSGEEIFTYPGEGSILGIDFTKYRKLKARGNVPYWMDGFEIGIGYGPVGAEECYIRPSEGWVDGKFFESKGDFELELDISSVKGKCPINLYAGGSLDSGEEYRAEINISELWVE